MQQNGVKLIWNTWSHRKHYEPIIKIETIDPFYVPQRLAKKEYEVLLKETQKEIDTRLDKIREHGALTRTGMFIDIYREQYVEKKQKIQSILKLFNKRGEIDVQKAKQYPIPDLIEISHAGFAACPFHKEKTPSAKYYTDNNKLHCFGSCSKSFDSIDVYMEINSVDFITAVKALS